MNHGLIGIFIISTVIIVFYVWWYLPIRISRKLGLENPKEIADVEDTYRKTIGQAITAIALLVGLYLTIQQYMLSRRAQHLDQYQKGFDALKGTDVATHIGGIYALETLSKNEPDWQGSILIGLSAAAVTFSKQSLENNEQITPDAEAALAVIAFSEKPESLRYFLAKGKFRGVRLGFKNEISADLRRADLRESDLSGSDLYRSKFFEANLSLSKLNGANLASSDFSHARLVGTHLCLGNNTAVPNLLRLGEIPAQLADSKFFSAFLNYAMFHGADLKKARFDDASLIRASFIGAEMDEKTSFRHSDLTSADLSNISAKAVNFDAHRLQSGEYDVLQRTILNEATFRDADLEGAKFNLADLTGADFRGANLSSADLSGAIVTDVKLEGAYLCKTVWSDGTLRSDDCHKKWNRKAFNIPKCG